MPPELHITIPLMDELEHLPVLINCIEMQDWKDFVVHFCVNQPEAWWDDAQRRGVCERNQESIRYIREHALFPLNILDRCSRGNGWQGRDLGVGWARKVAMDAAAGMAGPGDIIISLDGDTTFGEGYFSSVLQNFAENPDAVGLSVPYYHRLCGREAEDRAILRYEIYMRNYAINMWRISNPYSFTALGSAMAVPAKAYRAIGGMSPKKSGEDFYFLQKLVKYGRLLTWNTEKVYPAARFSDRVFFGTGPAMIRGATGDWSSYPVYHYRFFDDVRSTYAAFPLLFGEDVATPLDSFIKKQLSDERPWDPLRRNSTTSDRFVKACSDRIDGLRILQYLKHSQRMSGLRDEDCLLELIRDHYPHHFRDLFREDLNFDKAPVQQLDAIRDVLAEIEASYQRKHHNTHA